MYKHPWQEWQLYVFGLIYLFLFAVIQVSFFKNPSFAKLLDFVLIYVLYERIWHINKDVTFKKILKTVLWAAIGNVAIFLIGLLIALVYKLFV